MMASRRNHKNSMDHKTTNVSLHPTTNQNPNSQIHSIPQVFAMPAVVSQCVSSQPDASRPFLSCQAHFNRAASPKIEHRCQNARSVMYHRSTNVQAIPAQCSSPTMNLKLILSEPLSGFNAAKRCLSVHSRSRAALPHTSALPGHTPDILTHTPPMHNPLCPRFNKRSNPLSLRVPSTHSYLILHRHRVLYILCIHRIPLLRQRTLCMVRTRHPLRPSLLQSVAHITNARSEA